LFLIIFQESHDHLSKLRIATDDGFEASVDVVELGADAVVHFLLALAVGLLHAHHT